MDLLRDQIERLKETLETEEDPREVELINHRLITAQAELEIRKDAIPNWRNTND